MGKDTNGNESGERMVFGLSLIHIYTYPDISLLPALARLLKIDMNELFSFHEELTEKEIGQFVDVYKRQRSILRKSDDE